MSTSSPKPTFVITKEESIVGKRSKPAANVIHDGIYITVSEPNPIFQTNSPYEYRTGPTKKVWAAPYVIRTPKTLVIYRVTFENMQLDAVDLHSISMLIGTKLEPAYYAQYAPLEKHYIGQKNTYQYLEGIAEEIVEAL